MKIKKLDLFASKLDEADLNSLRGGKEKKKSKTKFKFKTKTKKK